jgi:hypothetical protein
LFPVRLYNPGDVRGSEKKFEAVFAEWSRWECRIVAIALCIEDENDALEISEDWPVGRAAG